MRFQIFFRLPDRPDLMRTSHDAREDGWAPWGFQRDGFASAEGAVTTACDKWLTARRTTSPVVRAIFQARLAAGEIAELPPENGLLRIQAKIEPI